MTSSVPGPAHAPGRQTDSQTDWPGIALGLALASFAAFQMLKLPPVLPVLLETYGYPRTLAGGFMSVYALAGLLLSIPLGRLLERFGFLGPLVGACALFALGNLLGLAAPELGWLVLAARGIEGISFALMAIAGPSLATRSAGARDAGLVVGIVAAWIPLGQIAAALLAHGLTPEPGWQALWWIAIVASAALAGWVALWRRRLPGPVARRGLPGGGAKLTGRQLYGLVLGGALFMIWSGQFFAFMTWLPQYLVEAAGLGLQAALLGYLLPVVVILVLNIVTGLLLGRGVSHAALLLAALASQSACWWAMPHVDAGLGGALLLVVYGLGAGASPTCLFAIPGRIAGAVPSPSAFSIIMTGRNLGVFVGPLLIAAAVEGAGGDWSVAAPIFGSICLAAVGIALLLAPQLKRS